jgi:alanyl-tRNA synthetase
MTVTIYRTDKLYYHDQYATRNETDWARRSPGVIALARSVAFPEGGGQLGDRGSIRQGDLVATFGDTRKTFGRCFLRADFPMIHVDTEVQLVLDQPLSDDWDERRPIEVVINADRRAALTHSHTAAHLVYLGILGVEPEAAARIKGCYIEPAGGRFDLALTRFSQDQVEEVNRIAADWQAADHHIDMEALPGEPECRIWVCNGRRIPCGGTHLERTGPVGAMSVRRRSKGSSIERVYYTLGSRGQT